MDKDELLLLPAPRTLTAADGVCALTPHRRIVLEGAAPGALLGAGRRLQAALAAYADLDWELAANPLGPPEEIGVVLRVAPGAVAHAQGYTLTITPEQVVIEAPAPVGVFYGVCTLAQIVQQRGRALPALQITDWPDFALRGVMLDISRDKVPRMETLLALVDMLAGWKLNQIQLYTEHTFAYRQHPTVWAKASPLTLARMLAYIAADTVSSDIPLLGQAFDFFFPGHLMAAGALQKDIAKRHGPPVESMRNAGTARSAGAQMA